MKKLLFIAFLVAIFLALLVILWILLTDNFKYEKLSLLTIKK